MSLTDRPEAKDLGSHEPFFGQRTLFLDFGATIDQHMILDQLQPLIDAIYTRSLQTQNRRSPLKKLLTHAEYNKYRRLRRRLAYWEELGYVELV